MIHTHEPQGAPKPCRGGEAQRTRQLKPGWSPLLPAAGRQAWGWLEPGKRNPGGGRPGPAWLLAGNGDTLCHLSPRSPSRSQHRILWVLRWTGCQAQAHPVLSGSRLDDKGQLLLTQPAPQPPAFKSGQDRPMCSEEGMLLPTPLTLLSVTRGEGGRERSREPWGPSSNPHPGSAPTPRRAPHRLQLLRPAPAAAVPALAAASLFLSLRIRRFSSSSGDS